MKQEMALEDATIIQPTLGWRNVNVLEVWRYRELLFFFAWRDIIVRYKQTVLGIAWAVIQPFVTMLVFSLFFGKLANISSEGIPYPIFVYTGLLPWTYFSQSLTRSSESIVNNAGLIRKIYFPRLIIPLSASLSALVDFFISCAVLFGMMVYYKIIPSSGFVFFPLLVLATFLCSSGAGFWLSALNARYRDVRHIVPFVVQLGMFLTPVIYPVSIIPDKFSWLIYLNPMAGIIESYRAVIIGYKSIPVFGLAAALAITAFFFISGILYFRRKEKEFADVV